MTLSEDEIAALLKAVELYTFFFIILIALCFFALIFVLIMLARNIKARHQLTENTQFIGEVVSVQENERKRISQELHDTVSQNIKVLLMMEKKLLEEGENRHAELVSASYNDRSRIEFGMTFGKQLEKIISLEKQNQKELRSIIQNLSVPELDGVPFKTLIESVCEEFQKASGCKCTFFVAPEIDLEKFSEKERHNILRIIQEALNNVKNHAKASEASVIFQKKQSKIRIMIFDDGEGFDESKSKSTKSNGEKHFGISGMEMRAKLIGGKLIVKSSAETGTEICVEIEKKNLR